MFFLKQLFYFISKPWSLLWVCLLVLFILRNRQKRIYRYGVRILVVIIYLLSLTPVKYVILYPLEVTSYKMSEMDNHQYHEAQAIVVLGGGITLPGKWGSPQLGLDSLSRLNHAVEIYQSLDGKIPIIFSTGISDVSKEIPSEAGVAESYFKQWSIRNYYLEDRSRNTYENAVETKKVFKRLGWSLEKPIILVTSALHLPRATAVFQNQGFIVLPSPSHYQVASSYKGFDIFDFLPRVENLNSITYAWHEYIGLLYYKLLGRI